MRKKSLLVVIIVCLLLILIPLYPYIISMDIASPDYIITASSTTYTATDGDGSPITSGSSASTVIADVIALATSGNTIKLIGVFPLSSQLSLNKGLNFDLSSATLSSSAYCFYVNGGSGYYFYGGTVTTSGTISFYMVNCQNVLIENVGITGTVIFGYGSSGMKIQDSNVDGNGHDGIDFLNNGYNEVTGCTIHDVYNGIFAGHSSHNTVTYNDFSNWHVSGGHANYFDGGSNTGYNEFAHNNLHDGVMGAGFHIKCKNNDIHHNTFTGLNSACPPFSLYSEHSGYEANDNDIHHNAINNCYWGFNFGTSTTGGEVCRGNKIHDNYISGVQRLFVIAFFDSLYQNVEDTLIYYNTITNCGQVFWSSATNSKVVDMVVAYNDFTGSTPSLSVLQSYSNAMVYGNINLADYNDDYQSIPPSGGPLPSPTASPSPSPTPTAPPNGGATNPTVTPTPSPSSGEDIINEEDNDNIETLNYDNVLVAGLLLACVGAFFVWKGNLWRKLAKRLRL